MEMYNKRLGFVGTLMESRKIFKRKGKLMSCIALISFVTQTLFHYLNVLSTKSLISDMHDKQILLVASTPGSPEFANLLLNLKQEVGILIGLEWIYLLLIFITSLLLAVATIIASSMIYSGKDLLTFKTLLLMTVRSWKRPFFTLFYITLFVLGYIFLELAILLPMALIITNPVASFAATIVLALIALVLYVYLSVVWTLALVISVLEEVRGIRALGKAARLAKGMKRDGFLLNLLYTVVSCALVQATYIPVFRKSMLINTFIGLLVTKFVLVVRMFWLISFTVFYYQCKKTHGEKTELEEEEVAAEYSSVPTSPLLGEHIP